MSARERHRQTRLPAVLAALACLALAGCGQKGPLTLPAPADDAAQEENDDEEGAGA